MILRNKFQVCILAILALFIIYYKWNINSESTFDERIIGFKNILFWNNYFLFENFDFGHGEGQDIFLNAGCRVNTCYATNKRDFLPVEEFDAIMFHAYKFSPHPSILSFWDSPPRPRRSHQMYVFFLMEPPNRDYPSCRRCDDFFNWTMTYRHDSDIPHPYGQILPLNTLSLTSPVRSHTWLQPRFQQSDHLNRVIAKKQKLVAWLVSNCHSQSRREDYVGLLSKHVPLDVYGDCGDLEWPKDDYIGFFEMLSAKYKFYLSFENSLCKDYVTEKFFSAMKYNVVPVVFGKADYKKIAPPMSYIDVNDFETPQKLAEYLLFLDRNPKEYAKFFWWKNHYSVVMDSQQPLCRLCEMLHEDKPNGKYMDMDKWWRRTCRWPPPSS